MFLLSICIPTYNRKFQLESLVNSILNQKRVDWNELEIVISDNDSTDGTKEFLQTLSLHKNIITNINDKNYGAAFNVKEAVRIAHGKYIWVIGDDDLVVDNKLVDVVDLLKKEKHLEFFMFNNFYWHPKENHTETYNYSSVENKLPRTTDYSCHPVKKMSELIGKREDAFTAIYSFIMLNSHWKQACNVYDFSKPTFSKVENCFFHAVYIAKNLFHEPGYYYGMPVTLASHSLRWENERSIVAVQYMADLYDLWIKNDASKKIVKQYKKELLDPQHKQMVICLLKKKTGGYQYFSFSKYLRQFYGIYTAHDLFDILKGCLFKENIDYKLKSRIFLSKIKRTYFGFLFKK